MKLTPEERDQLRQRFLIDVDVNIDRLIVITEQALAKKYDDEIIKVRNDILSLVQDSIKDKIKEIIEKRLLPGQPSNKPILTQ